MKKNGRNCDGGGGGVHSCRKYVEKHSTNLDMSRKALVKKISMLKSNYVEAGREQPGYKILIYMSSKGTNTLFAIYLYKCVNYVNFR